MLARGTREEPATDDGLTLAELVISMFIAAVIASVTVAATISFTDLTRTSVAMSDNAFDARRITDTLSRDARNITWLGAPATTTAGVFVEYEIDYAGPGTQPECVQWMFDPAEGQVMVRRRAEGASATGWTRLAEDVASATTPPLPLLDASHPDLAMVAISATGERNGVGSESEARFALHNVHPDPTGLCTGMGRP